MNGVHDMGGMHGFGPIEREIDEPVFHAEWEGHVVALQRLTVGLGYVNLDAFRYGIERMPPAEYLRASYYERWLATIVTNLIERGYLTEEDLAARVELLREQPDAAIPPPATPPATGLGTYGEPDASLPDLAPRFAVGDAVITRNVHPAGHTRLPRYARGKRGVVQIVHGPEVFADTNALYLGRDPQVVYNVRFDARDLWGDSAEPRQTVAIDLFEAYLEPAAD